MKKLTPLLLFLLVIFMYHQTAEANNLSLSAEYSVYHTSTEKVKVTCYNCGTRDIISGNLYVIDYEEDGKWKKLPLNKNVVYDPGDLE